MTARRWTPEEDQHLRERYATEGSACGEAINRSIQAVRDRAHCLGISKIRWWTDAEDNRLAMMWGVHPIRVIAKALDRGEGAIYDRANHLELGLGCPQGHESITAAAARTGFDKATLFRILKWAHVRMDRTWSSPRHEKRGGSRRVVEPEDVDAAVARWCATQPVTSVAEDLGVNPETLRRLMRDAIAAGDNRVEKPRGKNCQWRLTPELGKELLEGYLRLETRAGAAKRLGIHPRRLARALRAMGIPTSHRFRIRPEDADRAAEALRRSETGDHHTAKTRPCATGVETGAAA